MAAPISRGKRLKDRYRLERTLGHGGMAAVWLGHDEVLDRPVAVKVLADTISSDPSFVARFRREAMTVAGLSHPNLVGVYDFSDQGERPYLVMEFVPGETLASLITRGERFDCEQLARELLDAIAHIHEAGILHRDIKPANVVIEPCGTAKMIDFGIALPRDATALTRTGLVLGTERYAAPEVLAGKMATERSDLYSCGVLLQSCHGRCSPAFAALVRAMTSKDPRGRPLSAAHALEELEGSQVGEQPTEVFEPIHAGHTERLSRTGPRALPADADRAHSSGRWKVTAAILGVLAAVAIVTLLALNGSDAPEKDGKQMAGAAEKRGSPAKEPSAPRAEARPQTGTATPAQPVGTDSATGAALNEEGFALIQTGEYEAAVPVLEEAIRSFPAGTEDLNYAYALFNLGNALRLSGRPAEAIPLLERRLEIPNQEGAVREELEAAYADAGEPTPLGAD